LGPIRALAALDLRELGHQLPAAAIEIVLNSLGPGPLEREPQSRSTGSLTIGDILSGQVA